MIINNTNDKNFNDIDKLFTSDNMEIKRLKNIKANDFLNILYDLVNENIDIYDN